MTAAAEHRESADLVLKFTGPDGQVVEKRVGVDVVIPIRGEAGSVEDGVLTVQFSPLVDRARIEVDGVTIGELNPDRAPNLDQVGLEVNGNEIGAWSLS